MIIKFDGIDGCGKSTLTKAVGEYLSSRQYSVAVLAEFSSPSQYAYGSSEPVPMTSMSIREAVLDPAFDCDDVERQLLLHFLSRRKNRVEIPHLHELNDFVIVDRSTLSNYANAAALGSQLAMLPNIAVSGVETADYLFWIDTPLDVCMARVHKRSLDAVEQKGRAYFERVLEGFHDRARDDPTVHILDGSMELQDLLARVISTLDCTPSPGP